MEFGTRSSDINSHWSGTRGRFLIDFSSSRNWHHDTFSRNSVFRNAHGIHFPLETYVQSGGIRFIANINRFGGIVIFLSIHFQAKIVPFESFLNKFRIVIVRTGLRICRLNIHDGIPTICESSNCIDIAVSGNDSKWNAFL